MNVQTTGTALTTQWRCGTVRKIPTISIKTPVFQAGVVTATSRWSFVFPQLLLYSCFELHRPCNKQLLHKARNLPSNSNESNCFEHCPVATCLFYGYATPPFQLLVGDAQKP